jgi:2-keto-4-pentenoate hydratase
LPVALDPHLKAERIATLFRRRRHIDVLPRELYPGDIGEAYAVQAAFQSVEVARGRGTLAGYKVALTTRVTQELCGTCEPCYGGIFDSQVYRGAVELHAAEYLRLGVGAEIAVRIGEDLPTGGDLGRVGAAVESCMAAIELTEDLGYDLKQLDALALVAGNAWNAGIVLGMPVYDWHRLNLAECTARITINGTEIGVGTGADALGHPLNALSWVANKLADQGTPLLRGQVVMTGSLVPVKYPSIGDRVVAEVDGLGDAGLVVG